MRTINYLVIIISSFFMMSCYEQDNYSYPEVVSFNKDGGEIKVRGENSLCSFAFVTTDTDDFLGSSRNDYTEGVDTIWGTYDWLTVKTKTYSHEIVLSAKPLEGDKGRSVRVELHFGNKWGEIKVKQFPF